MIVKPFFKVASLFATIALLLFSCVEESQYVFAPYKGYKWLSPHQGDTLCLELTSAEDALLLSMQHGRALAAGKYDTHRFKFSFSNFEPEIDGVQYRFHYALFDYWLNMVLYGDSLDADCDTAWVEWSRDFLPTDPSKTAR